MRFFKIRKNAVDTTNINDKNNILAMYLISFNYNARTGLKKGWF
jgi:hypothetical protein